VLLGAGTARAQNFSILPNQGQAIAEAIMLGTAHEVCNGLYMSDASLLLLGYWKIANFHIRTSVEALLMSPALLLMLMHTM